jgi:serine protease Do
VVIALAGQPVQMDTKEFNQHIKLHYKLGDTLPLTVLRNGERKEIRIKLVE